MLLEVDLGARSVTMIVAIVVAQREDHNFINLTGLCSYKKKQLSSPKKGRAEQKVINK